MSQPPSYGSMPPPPPELGQGPGHSVPAQVQRAASSLYGLAAVQVLSFLVGIFSSSAEDAIRETDPSLTESEVSTLVTVGLVFSAVVSIAFAGLYVLCARKSLAGRAWARILGTVLTGLVVILSILALTGGALIGGTDVFTTILSVVGLALAVVFLVSIWSRPSNEFFAATGRPR